MVEQIVKSEESNLIKRLKDLENGSTVLISSDNEEKRKEQFLEDIKKITVNVLIAVNVLKNHSGNYYSIFLKEHKFIKVYFKSHLYDTDFSKIQGIPSIDFWYRYNAGKISKSFEDMAKCRFSNEDNRYILNFKKEKKEIKLEEIINEENYMERYDHNLKIFNFNKEFAKIICDEKVEKNVLLLSNSKEQSKKMLEDLLFVNNVSGNLWNELEILKIKNKKGNYYIFRRFILGCETKSYRNSIEEDSLIKYYINNKNNNINFDLAIIDINNCLNTTNINCNCLNFVEKENNLKNFSLKEIDYFYKKILDETKRNVEILKSFKDEKTIFINFRRKNDAVLFLKRVVKELNNNYNLYFYKLNKYLDNNNKKYFKIENNNEDLNIFKNLKIYLEKDRNLDYCNTYHSFDTNKESYKNLY